MLAVNHSSIPLRSYDFVSMTLLYPHAYIWQDRLIIRPPCKLLNLQLIFLKATLGCLIWHYLSYMAKSPLTKRKDEYVATNANDL